MKTDNGKVLISCGVNKIFKTHSYWALFIIITSIIFYPFIFHLFLTSSIEDIPNFINTLILFTSIFLLYQCPKIFHSRKTIRLTHKMIEFIDTFGRTDSVTWNEITQVKTYGYKKSFYKYHCLLLKTKSRKSYELYMDGFPSFYEAHTFVLDHLPEFLVNDSLIKTIQDDLCTKNEQKIYIKPNEPSDH